MLRIGASRKAPILLRHRPAARARHHDTALARLVAEIPLSDARSGCRDAERRRESVDCPVCERPKQNAPGCDPRAFAFLGDRATDLRGEDQSSGMWRSLCMPAYGAHGPASRSNREVQAGLPMWRKDCIEVIALVWCSCRVLRSPLQRMGAHLTPAFSRMQGLFRRTVGMHRRRSSLCVRSPAFVPMR